MNKRIIKSIVSVMACASIVTGMALISSANTYSINNGSSKIVGTKTVNAGDNNYSYSITYIQYDGLPMNTYATGLRLRADRGSDSDNVCAVISSSSNGTYHITTSGSHTYRLYNNTGKNVTLTGYFSY